MGTELRCGGAVIGACLAFAELGIEDAAGVAIRVAKVVACGVDDIDLVIRGVIAQPVAAIVGKPQLAVGRSEEHTSELQSLMRISYAVFCLKKKKLYI